MKKIIILCLVILYATQIFAQEEKEKRIEYEISLGSHYSSYFGNKHVKFTPEDYTNSRNTIDYTIYGGFDYNNTFSYDAAFTINYLFKNNFYASLGIDFFTKKERLTSSPDTVLYYHSLYDYHQLATSYVNHYHIFSLQSHLGYQYKSFFAEIGFSTMFFNITQTKRKKLDGTTNGYIYTSFSRNYSRIWDDLTLIYPSFLIGSEIHTFETGQKLSLSTGIKAYSFYQRNYAIFFLINYKL